MWRQLKQVGITYLTRPKPLEWAGYVLFCVLFISLLIGGRDELKFQSVFVFFFAGAAPGLLFTNQLRWQFCHPRARLTPGFQTPHLIVWTILMLVFAVAVPLAVTARGAISPWFVICAAAVGAAASQGAAIANSLLIPAAFAATSIGDRMLDEQTIHSWLTAEGYRRPALAVTTLLALAATVWHVMRIGALAEDDPRFPDPIVADRSTNVSRSFRLAREKATARANARPSIASASVSRWLDRQIRRAPKLGPWRRINIAFIERQSALAYLGSALFLGIFLPAIIWSGEESRWNWDADRLMAFSIFPAMATAAAAFVPATKLAARIPQMTSERLLPMSNQGYADALVGVCLWHAVRTWLVAHAVAAIVVFALPWEWLDPPTPSNTAAYLAISLAGLTYCFGVSMFCSPMQGCFPVLFAGGTGVLATLALQGYWLTLRPHDSQGVVMFCTVVLYAAGLGFLWRARQLWRHKELGSSLADRAA